MRSKRSSTLQRIVPIWPSTSSELNLLCTGWRSKNLIFAVEKAAPARLNLNKFYFLFF
jgi:hypothetical protein